MFRKQQKQNHLHRAKSDASFLLSPKKGTLAHLNKTLRFEMQQKLSPPSPKTTLTGNHFNSPRKKYLPPELSACSQASIIEQYGRQEHTQRERKLAAILQQQKKNLQKQRQFLLGEEMKIDEQNQMLRQRIQALTLSIRKLQISKDNLRPYLPQKQKDEQNGETQSSDFFKC